MEITFLGTGTSYGVPRIGCTCSVCTSNNEKNKRLRSSIYIKEGDTSIVVDTGPEFRLQMLINHITDVSAVLYTHNHADHINGIDDLRVFSETGPLEVFGPKQVIDDLHHRFAYAIGINPYIGGLPQLKTTTIPLKGLQIGDMQVIPIPLVHGCREVYGYRIGPFAYLSDCKEIPPSSYEKLVGVEVVVLDALRYKEHPTHMNLDQAIAASRLIGAKETYLTHLSHDFDHDTLTRDLPRGMFPSYDGLILHIDT
ncbi:MAG: MBL fold metallo-hydrolase [Spirochaetia bacterium]|nr:MBL fold metallo-hydrolase [Spirochaetia bacterium]